MLPATLKRAGGAVAAAAMLSLLGAAPSDVQTVSVASVKAMTMAPTFSAPGSVVAMNDAHVASEVEGKIVWVASVGDIVKAGDPVAKLDDALLKLQYTADIATVSRLRATVHYDEAQAARMTRLAKSDAIATSTVDEALSTRDADKAQLAEAVADAAKSKFQLSYDAIRAPFPGRVAARLINPGEYAVVGKDIVRLVDIDDVEVSAPAPISASRYLKPGTPLTLEIEGKPVIGKVRAFVPVGDVNSRTIEVRIVISAKDGVVGDAVKVLIPSAPQRKVLAVPRDALVLREDNTYVFRLVNRNRVEHVAVETGSEQGAFVEITAGLKAGDTIVVKGAERLETGQTVRPVP
jgi:RND family efflux transporter MFP subunit